MNLNVEEVLKKLSINISFFHYEKEQKYTCPYHLD